jgi:murein DD-endopeptidase MepM/ murein hydrolase activator NlpD
VAAARRRACILAVVAATVTFGSMLSGRAAAQIDPTPTPTETPMPTETPTPTDSPSPSATDSPSPDPSPSATDSPLPDPSPSATDSQSPSPTDLTPTPTPTPTPSPTDLTPTPTPTPTPAQSTAPPPESAIVPPAAEPSPEAIDARSRHERTLAVEAQARLPIAGTYSTAALDDVYQKLVKTGMSRDVATRRVYRPFVVRGPAAWADTWHAARYTGGFHLHEGQDVFCEYGAPVLAAVAGRVEFDVDTLGGRIARLFMPDGSYWYYAHLSEWSSTIQSGSDVDVGDVIGYCGDSGDAAGGPPHVHFGHYLPSGAAVDPMSDLIGWLRAAERRAGVPPRASEEATPIVVPAYRVELGAEPTVTVMDSIATAAPSAVRRSAATPGTDVLALAVLLGARLLLIPGRRLVGRLASAARSAR